MKVSIKLKGVGEQNFFVQPYENHHGDKQNQYILIRYMTEVKRPLIVLHLDMEQKSFVFDSKLCDIDEQEDVLTEKMHNLAMEVLESQQQGKDLSAADIPEEEKVFSPYNPDQIRVEPSTMSLRQVYDMIMDEDINLSPDFQRNAIWDNRRKCRLIESILLRIPLPVFYFSADKEGKLSVVDGLQRLTAIKEFMDNKLPLSALEYLDSCVGCTYNNGNNKLDERLYRRFNLTQITINIIDSSSPTRVKYDIFRRLNTGGRPLNAQELRNCLASNALRKTLKEMAQSETFKNATTRSISDERMEAQECALRFMYFRYLQKHHRNGIEGYSGIMDVDLDAFVDQVSSDKNFPYDEYIKDYERAMTNAQYLFGRHAFRKVYKETEYESDRSVINKALFLSLSVLLADCSIEDVKLRCERNSWVKVLGEKISNDEYLLSMLSYGTNGWKNIMTVFSKIKEIIQEKL